MKSYLIGSRTAEAKRAPVRPAGRAPADLESRIQNGTLSALADLKIAMRGACANTSDLASAQRVVLSYFNPMAGSIYDSAQGRPQRIPPEEAARIPWIRTMITGLADDDASESIRRVYMALPRLLVIDCTGSEPAPVGTAPSFVLPGLITFPTQPARATPVRAVPIARPTDNPSGFYGSVRAVQAPSQSFDQIREQAMIGAVNQLLASTSTFVCQAIAGARTADAKLTFARSAVRTWMSGWSSHMRALYNGDAAPPLNGPAWYQVMVRAFNGNAQSVRSVLLWLVSQMPQRIPSACDGLRRQDERE